MTANLYGLLRERFPSRGAAVFLDCPGRGSLSYGEMDALSARYAAALRSAGVRDGDRVVVQVDKKPEAVALYLACLRTGAVYVPLNTAYTAAEVEFFLGDCTPALFVAEDKQRAELEPAARRAGVHVALALDGTSDSLASRAARHPPTPELAARREDDLAAIVYTSGTTGHPKGAMVTIGNLISNGLALHRIWGWRKGDVLLHALPIFHVHGLFVALHCAMLNGSRVLLLPRFDVEAVRAHLPRASVMMGVPTFYTRLLRDAAFGAEDCRNMRLFISGSAPLAPRTFAEFEARTEHRILERYGMSEAGIIASNPLNGPRLPGTVGFPLPEVEVRIRAVDGAKTNAQEVGMLEIRGPNLFAGYWGLSEKTANEFRPDGFFVTGDLARISADGRITLVGRARDLIISGGYNIYPKEIERHLDDLPEVLESAVVGVPHPDFGEAAIAVIVPARPEAFDLALIQRVLDAAVARFKHPKRLFLLDALPRNAMGKVQKNVLRQRYARAFDR